MIGALTDPSSRRAVVVAHPDDETLWCGGLMIRYPGDWTVICCSTPKRDPIRSDKFRLACARLGARDIIHVKEVETRNVPLATLGVPAERFDLVVTHGAAGEYGHPHHVQVHKHYKERMAERGGILAIGYGRKSAVLPALTIELTDDEWAAKLEALKCYDHLMSWDGRFIPTWQALLAEYGTPGKYHGFNLRQETYDQ
jgi:LmbE family N-acetylglucosaminyl deacetylase